MSDSSGAIVRALVSHPLPPSGPYDTSSVFAESLDALAHFNKSLVGRVGDARQEARALKAKFREEASRNRDAQDQFSQLLRDTTLERKVLLTSMNAIAAAVDAPSTASSATLDRVKEEVRRVRDFLQTSMKKATLDMQSMESKLKLSQKEAALMLDKMTTQNRYAIPALEEEVGVFESKSSELDTVLQLDGASVENDSAPSPTRRSLDVAFEQVDPMVEKEAELAALRAQLADQARLHEEALHTAAVRLEQSVILAGRDKTALEAEVARLEAALAASRAEEERLETALGTSQAELTAANDEAVAAMRYAQEMLANVEASRAQAQTASYEQRAAAEEMAAIKEAAEAGRGALEADLETERDKTRFLQQELVSLRQDMSKSLITVQGLESKTRADAQRAADDDEERRRLMRVLDQLTDQLTAAHDECKQARAQGEVAEEKFLAELQTLLEANRVLEDEVAALHYEAAEHHARANDALRRMAAAKELELEMEPEDLRNLGSPPRTPSRGGSAQGTPSRSVMFGDDDAPMPTAMRSSSLEAGGGLGASLDSGSGSGSGLGIDTSGDFDLLGHSYAADRPEILQRQVDQLQKDNEALAEAMAASKAQMEAALTIVRVELGEVKDRHAAQHDELESERLKTASLERLLRQHLQDAEAPPPSPAKPPMTQEQERLLEKMFDSVERERLRLTDKNEALEKALRISETGKALFQASCKSAKTETTAAQQALEQQRSLAAEEKQGLDRELSEARNRLVEERATVAGQFGIMAKLTADFQAAKAEANESKEALETLQAASAQKEKEAAETAQAEAEAHRLAMAETLKAAQQEAAALGAALAAEKALAAKLKAASEQASAQVARLTADLDTLRDASVLKDQAIIQHLEARTASESQAKELRTALEQQRAVADTQNMMLGIHSTDLHMAKLALEKERQNLLEHEVGSASILAAVRHELQQASIALAKEREVSRVHAEARDQAYTELEAAAQSLVVVQSTSAKHALSAQDLSTQLAATRAELDAQSEAARQQALLSTITEGRLSQELFDAKKVLLERDGALAKERETAGKMVAALAAAQSELATAKMELAATQQQAELSAKTHSEVLAEHATYTSVSELERANLQRRLQEVLASGASLSSRVRHTEGVLRASQQACAAAEKKALDAEHARQLAQLRVEAQDEDLARLRRPPLVLADAASLTEPLAALSAPAPESPPSPAHNRLVAAALSENRARDQALAESLERCRLVEAELGTLRHATSQTQEGQLEALRAAERALAAERAATQHATTVAAQMEKELRGEADAVRQSLRRVEAEKSELSERLESVNLQLLARHKEATVVAARESSSSGESSHTGSSSSSSGSSAITPSADRSAKALTRAIDELRTKRAELARLRLDSTVAANAMREEMALKERLLADKEAERARLATKLVELEGLLEEVERRFAEAGGSAETGSLVGGGDAGSVRLNTTGASRSVLSTSPAPRRNLTMAWQPGGSLLKAKLPAAYLGTGIDISMLARAGDDSFSSDVLRTPARDSRALSDPLSPVSFALEEDELEEVDFSGMPDEQEDRTGDDEGSNRDSSRRGTLATPADAHAQAAVQGQPIDLERQSQLRRLEALSARNSEAYRPTPSSAQRPDSSFNFFQAIPLPFFGFQASSSSDAQQDLAGLPMAALEADSGSSSISAAGNKGAVGPAGAETEELVTCRRELQFTLSRLEATMQSKQRLALSVATSQREAEARIQSLEEQVRSLLKDLQAFGYTNVAASRDSYSDTGGAEGTGSVFVASDAGQSAPPSASSPTPTPSKAAPPTPAAASTPAAGPDRADRVVELERELKVARANSKMSTSAAQRAASATAIEMRVLRAELADAQSKARHSIEECSVLQTQAAAAEEEYAKAAHLLLETVESSRKSQERRVDELSADLAKMKDKARNYRAKCEQVLARRREEKEAYRKEVEHLRRSLLALRERGLLRSGEGDSGGSGGEDDDPDSGDDGSDNVFSVFSVASSIQGGVEDVV